MVETQTLYSSAFSSESDSNKAGESVGTQLREALGAAPQVAIVFASSVHDYFRLLKNVKQSSDAKIVVGCSSAGEFAASQTGTGAVSALGILSDGMEFSCALGEHLDSDRAFAANKIVEQLSCGASYTYKTLILFADALAGHTDELIEEITTRTGGKYQIVGGGAGDDANFSRTHVFFEGNAYTSAAVALEVCSHKPLGIGVRHGWVPASTPMRVTAADGMHLISLNATSPLEIFQEHAKATGQTLNVADPVPFFLHNTLGIKVGDQYKLRVPLQILEDGSIVCASNVPVGSTVCIMRTEEGSAKDAAVEAVDAALLQLKGTSPKAAIFFDCVATRLRLGSGFNDEVEGVYEALGRQVQLVGCNTYGQIARVEGQFSGFHNCTAVVCVLPE